MSILTTARKMSDRTIISVAVVAFVAWVGNFYYGVYGAAPERGTLGDVFGIVNSLFSGMAFIGVIYSISIQREELSLAREDAKKTKGILDVQQKNLEKQNEELSLKSQEDTFFQLFRSFNDMVSGIDLRQRENISAGKDAMKVFFDRASGKFRGPDGKYLTARIEAFADTYDVFYKENAFEIGHYFRMLYTILRFVDDMKHEKAFFFAKLLRAQLSSSEANLLLLNYLSNHTSPRFNNLVNKYGILKNADFSHGLIVTISESVDPKAMGRTYMAK